MLQPVKVLFIIPHLGGGGAERVTSQLVRHLDRHVFAIHLGLIAADGPGAETPPAWVKVHRLEAVRVRLAAVELIRLIRRIRPAVVLSSMAHLNLMVLFLKPLFPRQTRLLVRHNSTASSVAETWFQKWLYRRLYPRAERVICQSNAMTRDLMAHFRICPSLLTVLANPIDGVSIRECVRDSQRFVGGKGLHPYINLLAVGRLSHEKGMDLLLRALPRITDAYPQVRLIILGSGLLDLPLERLVRELHLESVVRFAGHVPNPAMYFSTCTLFVLPSRYEGMPNAMLEAAAAGLPIVMTPCCEAVSQLVQDAPGVWLAHETSADALAEAVLSALSSMGIGDGCGNGGMTRFTHAFVAPFDLATAIKAYESLLLECASGTLR